MSVHELENEIKRLPDEDKRKFMAGIFSDCCKEIMDDTAFMKECMHTLKMKGVGFKDLLTKCD
jgi:hypothetical protein